MKILSISNFELREIDSEYQGNFICTPANLSDFQFNALCWISEAIAWDGANIIWSNNKAWWDDQNGRRYSVFMTVEGSAMLEDWGRDEKEYKLFRIFFNR